MDWEATPVKVLATNTRRAKWVSEDELEQRRRTGRCLRCGATGHLIRKCPYGPPRPPVKADPVRKEQAKAKEVEPELDDEEEPVSESEN